MVKIVKCEDRDLETWGRIFNTARIMGWEVDLQGMSNIIVDSDEKLIYDNPVVEPNTIIEEIEYDFGLSVKTHLEELPVVPENSPVTGCATPEGKTYVSTNKVKVVTLRNSVIVEEIDGLVSIKIS